MTEEVCMKSPPDHIVVWRTSDIRGGRGPRCHPPPWGEDGRETDSKRIEKGWGRKGRRGRARFPSGPLRVGVETLLWAGGVDVMKLLLLLRLDVLVFLHSAGILHVGPVCRQHHQVVDLPGIDVAKGQKKIKSQIAVFPFSVIWKSLRQYCHLQFRIKPSLVKFVTIFNSIVFFVFIL